jgi:Protein of unknown function (DUF2778)
VFVSKIVRAQSLRRLLRPLLITSFGTAIVGVAVWSAAGMIAISGTFASGSGQFLPKPRLYAVEGTQVSVSDKHARVGKAPRLVAAAAQPVEAASFAVGRGKLARLLDIAGRAEASGNAAPFGGFVRKAGLTSYKSASRFEYAKAKPQHPPAKVGTPAPERFASLPTSATAQSQILLAFADPSPAANGVWSAVLAEPLDDELVATQDPNLDAGDDAALPDDDGSLSMIPIPQLRPRGDQAPRPAAVTEEPGVEQAEEPDAPKADKPKTQQQLAYARPNEPGEKKSSGGLGGALRGLFGGGAKAGNGVAVYDIAAAKVYMPDGSVLEAHSGIGKMVDNPRYIDVKMGGPTPPHTYDLKMRETRFHGVEALRMLPVDGKNRNGRTGILAHSYLLRGGRAESHGCVAFKDYARFLKAFKQGKVKQLVVVPSGGRSSIRLASAGKNI